MYAHLHCLNSPVLHGFLCYHAPYFDDQLSSWSFLFQTSFVWPLYDARASLLHSQLCQRSSSTQQAWGWQPRLASMAGTWLSSRVWAQSTRLLCMQVHSAIARVRTCVLHYYYVRMRMWSRCDHVTMSHGSSESSESLNESRILPCSLGGQVMSTPIQCCLLTLILLCDREDQPGARRRATCLFSGSSCWLYCVGQGLL